MHGQAWPFKQRETVTMRLSGSFYGALLSVLMLVVPAQAATPSASEGLFGSQERARPVRGTHPFRSWARVVEEHLNDLRASDRCAQGDGDRACRVIEWLDSLAPLSRESLPAQLDHINRELNRNRHLTDLRNWGVEDYWATPQEFMRRSGDCEDYAITKFMSLRHLGLPDEAMRIVVVNDENLGVGHAVLVVYDGDRQLVLDNQTDQVVETGRIRHYRPIYSLNERGWWLHTR